MSCSRQLSSALPKARRNLLSWSFSWPCGGRTHFWLRRFTHFNITFFFLPRGWIFIFCLGAMRFFLRNMIPEKGVKIKYYPQRSHTRHSRDPTFAATVISSIRAWYPKWRQKLDLLRRAHSLRGTKCRCGGNLGTLLVRRTTSYAMVRSPPWHSSYQNMRKMRILAKIGNPQIRWSQVNDMIKFPGVEKGLVVTLIGPAIDLDILLTKKIFVEISIITLPNIWSKKCAVNNVPGDSHHSAFP